MRLYRVLLIVMAVANATYCAPSSIAQVTGPFDVVYRTAPNYRGGTDTLHLKWWMPSEVPTEKLPLIVWVHGGAFYAGNYVDMTANCKRWAEHGYIAVSVQYRLGFWGNLFDPPYAYDAAELVRACWRGMQDVRYAIREICKGALIPYIDTSCVILAGESAGSILVLQSVVADVADSIPKEVDSIATVVRGFDKWPRPALGDVDGFPVGSKRPRTPMPRICGVINHYGGLMHPYMLDAKSFPAIFSYHQKSDPIVACGVNRGLYGMPLGVGDNYPVLTGTCALVDLLDKGGHPTSLRKTMIVEGANHAVDNAAVVYAEEFVFTSNVICPSATYVHEAYTAPPSGSWMVIDVLGQILRYGTGDISDVREWVRVQNLGAAFIVFGNTVQPVWK